MEIWNGDNDHTKPYEGDSGIKFEDETQTAPNKIEIDISSLNKAERRIWVKATAKRKGHYRKIKGAKKVEVGEKSLGMSKGNVVTSVTGNEIGLKGSLHFTDIDILEFKDGSKAIHKAGMEPIQIVGETEYYNISTILGWDICPETIEIDMGRGLGSCQKWIPDGREPYRKEFGIRGIRIDEKHFDDLAKIFVQDIIVGNRDRHHLNVVIKGDKCYAIDNENWGNPTPSQDYMAALDFKVGLGIEDVESPMTKWLDDSLNLEEYHEFRQRVIKYMKVALKHKDEILSAYSVYYGAPDYVGRGAESIKWNIESIEKYFGGE